MVSGGCHEDSGNDADHAFGLVHGESLSCSFFIRHRESGGVWVTDATPFALTAPVVADEHVRRARSAVQ